MSVDTWPKWYACLTGPRAEQEASVNLRRAGYLVFYPHIREVVRVKQRGTERRLRKEVVRPLFPRYLFVALRSPQDSFEGIENAIGVSAIVRLRYSKVPLRIPNAAMTLMMDWADGEGLCPSEVVPHWFKGRLGDKVEYTDGVFQNIVATINSLAPLDSGDEIGIWVTLLGKETEVVAPLSTVKLLEVRA